MAASLPARMIAESKRVVPSSLPDGKRHMLIGASSRVSIASVVVVLGVSICILATGSQPTYGISQEKSLLATRSLQKMNARKRVCIFRHASGSPIKGHHKNDDACGSGSYIAVGEAAECV
eukprot:1141652-Pelagomonas_calceolata.AAC.2